MASLFALHIHYLFLYYHALSLLSVLTRSKSLSDIPMVYPVRKVPDGNTICDVGQDTDMAREWNQENKRKCSVAAKDSEAQWHDVSQGESSNKKMLTKQSHYKVHFSSHYCDMIKSSQCSSDS